MVPSRLTNCPVPTESVTSLAACTARDWAIAGLATAEAMPAAIIAARHVPSAARLMQLLLLSYLAPTGMTVTALPRAPRTTGPVGLAAAGSDGAQPAGALDCWAGTLRRDRKSGGYGKSGSVRAELGVRRTLQK